MMKHLHGHTTIHGWLALPPNGPRFPLLLEYSSPALS
jgi:hypothetical protein